MKALMAVMVIVGPAVMRPDQRQLKNFPLDEIIPNQFWQRGFTATWLTGNEIIYRHDNGNYVKFNVDDKTECVVLTSKYLAAWRGATIQLIKPEFNIALIRYGVRSVFRHTTFSRYALLDITTGNSYHIAGGEEVSVCILSPNGQSLAYVKDNNIFYRPNLLKAKAIRLTRDGVPGVLYNGVPDWVYEQEIFGTDATLWFSNDGSHIVMASFDDTEVKEFSYHMYGDPDDPERQYPAEYTIRYPKVNNTNPKVLLWVMDLNSPSRLWREIAAPNDIVGADHILGAVTWIGPNLGVIWTNRRQNVATFQGCIVQSLQCTEFARVSEPNGWYNLNPPTCTISGTRCFFLGDHLGWQRIWELDGATITYRSPTGFTVTEINGYDEVKNELYYTAVPSNAPHHRHVYRNRRCLTCSLLRDKLSNDTPCNFASVSISTDYSYFALTCSGPTPSYTQIFRSKDLRSVMDWEWNEAFRLKLSEYKETQIRFLKVPVMEGFEASVQLYVPPEIDFEIPQNNQNKYPMIVQVYGGPNSVRVTDSFGIGFANYMTTTKSTIYCKIDGRGTGNQGYNFLFTVNKQLGVLESDDQIAVTRYLQDKYSFIDRERTGIWGWSYGGFITSMTLEKDWSYVFRCGISIAPVTSWMFYDSIYTERFMGLPTEDDNQQGYKQGDVSRHVDGMKNHLFLLIHGNADDNVHYQNSMAFVRALVKENVQFEQMSYPDEAHNLKGVHRHLYHTMDNFWNQCFEWNNEI